MFASIPRTAAVSRWACAYFFVICGLAYGSVMSWIPAIKMRTALDEAQLGYALLCLGLGALTAFPLAGWAISRLGSRLIQIAGGLALLVLFPLPGIAIGQWSLCLAFFGMGFATGITEVAMSIQAILVERAEQKPRMSSLHAMFSLGGLAGALGGALLASSLSPAAHFYIISALFFPGLPVAASRLLQDAPAPRKDKEAFGLPPLFVLLCGLLALCCYAAEGSVGDWGALLLYEVKGASEQTAALAYAAFSIAMVAMRLGGDRLRKEFSDYPLIRILAFIATCGIVLAQFAPWPLVCVFGYALMGLGLSVIVPIIFSSVGKRSDVSMETGVTIISTMGYGGQLIVPPLIGMLGHSVGLYKAMFVVVFLCVCLVLGAGLFKPR